MKRYRDCTLVCNDNQTPEQLLDLVESVALEKGYKVVHNTSIVNIPTLLIKLNSNELPASNIVLGINKSVNGVSIINIVPLVDSGVTHINIDTYNQILELFKDDVFQKVREDNSNKIVTNNEDYTIQEIIPRSFNKLDLWLNGYPLSFHQYDINRWYDFVISLHKTGEFLSLDTLGQYVKERCGWSEDDITQMELRLESQLSLLEYYDEYRVD